LERLRPKKPAPVVAAAAEAETAEAAAGKPMTALERLQARRAAVARGDTAQPSASERLQAKRSAAAAKVAVDKVAASGTKPVGGAAAAALGGTALERLQARRAAGGR
jgi:hypothetical protein